jgi:hypothetical protein
MCHSFACLRCSYLYEDNRLSNLFEDQTMYRSSYLYEENKNRKLIKTFRAYWRDEHDKWRINDCQLRRHHTMISRLWICFVSISKCLINSTDERTKKSRFNDVIDCTYVWIMFLRYRFISKRRRWDIRLNVDWFVE